MLKNGDMINIDITVYHNGFHGDCSETHLVGNASDAVKNLVKVTHDAWQKAIDFCAPGKQYNHIGAIVEDYITPFGYVSVRVRIGLR
jgi:methionyl aminopeptidase